MLSPLPRFKAHAARHAPLVVVLLALTVGLVCWFSSKRAQLRPSPQNSKAPARARSAAESGTEAPVNASYGNLPLQFEANQGQAPEDVKFVSRGSGYNLHLKSDEAVLSLKKSDAESSTLRLRLVGSSPDAQIRAGDQLPGRVNYFVGNDRSKWRTDIRTFEEVQYKGIYPGIDLVYYGEQGKLEYDFVIAPGVDPRSIEVSCVGAKQLRVNETGALIVEIDDIELMQPAPVIYQEDSNGRQQVDGRYVLKGSDSFAFEIDNYDPNKPLVIDPTLTYSTFLGVESAQGLIVDSSGNAYLTGTTQSDVFVFKLNSSGTALIYSTIFGGDSNDTGVDIAVDTAGNTYVTGRTQSSNFPTVNAAQSSPGGSSGDQDAFITKINPSGTGLVYSTYLGGSGFDSTSKIVVSASGNACVVGGTSSDNFPTASAFQPAKNPAFGTDGFVTKLSASGSTFVYSTYLGGSGDDAVLAVALDASDNTYVAGRTNSTNFPTTVNARQPALSGDTDGFISKLSPSGNQLLYSTYHGGTGYDHVLGIALDSAGNIYAVGETRSDDFPLLNPIKPTARPFSSDVFVSKFNPAGSALIYSTYLGGNFDDSPWAFALDSTGNVYVTGNTGSPDFPVVQPLQPELSIGDDTFVGSNDIFITRINSAGNALTFSTYFGSSNTDIPYDIAVNSGGSIFIVGSTFGSKNFPITANAWQPTSNFFEAGFALRIDPAPANYFTISGKVTGVSFSIPIVLSGATSRTVNTDSNGRYEFHVLLEGTYTITPTSPPGYNLSPSSRTYAALNANHTDADFVVPPPANDNFANAQVITDTTGAINGTNIGATLEPGEITTSNASVWYRWQSPATAAVVLNYDTRIAGMVVDVFTGSSVNALTQVSGQSSLCNFSSCDVLATSFKAIANTVYFIRVANSSTGTGNFAFSFLPGVTISGHVKNVNGRDLPGATVRARRMDNLLVTATINTSSGYSLIVPPGFDYDVLAIFQPVNSFGSSIFNNLTHDVADVNFTALSPTITISGLLNNLTQGSAGVSVSATGTAISSKACNITNQSNNFLYTCTSLVIFGDYTIVPTSANYTFSPATRTFVGAPGDITGSFSASVAQLPTATTSAATNIALTTAALNGSINPNGQATDASFEWGTSDTLSTSDSTTQQAIGSGTTAVQVSANLTNLAPGTVYFFRAVATNNSGTTRGSILSFTTPVQVTVQTNPTGRSFSVDGGPAVNTAQVLQWIPGSSHTIATTSPQAVSADTQLVWSSWSDSGTISHTITAPAVNTIYTANFNTQYLLTMTAGTGGLVSPLSGFFNSGQSVSITATPNTGFIFNGWTGSGTGSFTGNTNPANVTMSGPITQNASFLPVTGLLLVLENSGQTPDQVAVLEAFSLVKDPFPVTSPFTWLYTPDPNTRLTIFLKNFHPVAGELPSVVVVNLVASNNQSFDIQAEDVRPLANSDLTQVIFRLPNNLAVGTCAIKVKAHSETTNSGTLKIKL